MGGWGLCSPSVHLAAILGTIMVLWLLYKQALPPPCGVPHAVYDVRCDCLLVFSNQILKSCHIPALCAKNSCFTMADKISDDQPGPTDNAVPNASGKGMDPEKQAVRSKDADAALEFLCSEGTTVMTEVDEKSLVRKVDWRIVPLMCKSSRYQTAGRSVLS